MRELTKIAFGGGCHWCTEAVFQSLIGVVNVEQGYVASYGEHGSFSEAVIVLFNDEVITLQILIEVHLHTHKSTSEHSMREKYRSAIYTFSKEQSQEAKNILQKFQYEFDHQLVTKVYPFSEFKASSEAIQNYHQKNPEKPFCKKYINPKLIFIRDKFSNQVNKNFIITN
ncbi:peptide-methionine (S)-S-oxide reductase [Maribacter sp. HTCC2170]|uniref:peptide-methionine (S)-S-oxide reductase n=1 Tax=Maribacter sp. (strain HTCC2170 / KCCM 42371) TaxID=313603 RepID=UPI0003057F32|nr:peptide-methionine (S)-S-oxide reductase [Maribacter sp. HTCC2170]